MRVVYGLGNIRFNKPSCVTIGVFDGVHRGHQAILKKVVSFARRNKILSIVLTFHPHPDSVVKRKKKSVSLISLKHRLYLISKLGIDACVVIRFNKRFKNIKPREFVEKILVKRCRMKHIFLGSNFLFGFNRKGTIGLLKDLSKEFGFRLHIQTLQINKQIPISSTLLRSLIQKGDLKKAEHLLGRNVELIGTVIGGNRLGRHLGFPTANIDPHHEVIPPRGVYLIEAWLGKRNIPGLANIGFRPTVKNTKEELIEVHLLNFKESIYGKDLRIVFLNKLRNEKKFASRALLMDRVQSDIRKARRFFHF